MDFVTHSYGSKLGNAQVSELCGRFSPMSAVLIPPHLWNRCQNRWSDTRLFTPQSTAAIYSAGFLSYLGLWLLLLAGDALIPDGGLPATCGFVRSAADFGSWEGGHSPPDRSVFLFLQL